MLESLRMELSPAPGRWRRSVFMGLGTVTALVLAWTVQVPTFSAPVVAFFGLLPANVCTWRNLPRRLALTTVGAILSITVEVAPGTDVGRQEPEEGHHRGGE